MQNVTPIKQENPIKVTPTSDQLTTKGVEMFKNMGDVENAEAFLNDLVMETGNDHVYIAGLLMILQAVREKIDANDCVDHPTDYIDKLQTYLFSWTIESERCADAYIQALQSGEFSIEKLIEKSAPQELKAVS